MSEQQVSLAGDAEKVAGDVAEEIPNVQSVSKQDAAAVEATVVAARELGHREEEIRELLALLWQRGVGVFMHSQPEHPAV